MINSAMNFIRALCRHPSRHRSIAQSSASAAVGCGPSNALMPRSSSQSAPVQCLAAGKGRRPVPRTMYP